MNAKLRKNSTSKQNKKKVTWRDRQKSRSKSRNNEHSTSKTEIRPNTPNIFPDSRNNEPCRFGKRCIAWQDGKCNYQHKASEMTCSYCSKSCHPKSNCYALKDAQRNNNPTKNPTPSMPHYNPYQPQTG